ncbi:unnamed protein product [Zymoseptoria tritici ST99CH_3D7]|uniref:BCAS3 domain-containing protein n=1 Tax=Zymoseptoria tritici (strain ST99CH_3D7) TaxID=1276538 RepID=A0A1X7RFQ3_ZYMT9|nr:unnamed protein product [Zymoseptoria tritici ST99CH_3D7]
MPSADDFAPTFEFDSSSPPVEAPDAWPSTSPPQPAKSKKKKKGKGKKHESREDGDESSSYPKSITPSPPVGHEGPSKVDYNRVEPAPAHLVDVAPDSSPEDLLLEDHDVSDLPPQRPPTEAAAANSSPSTAQPLAKSPKPAIVSPQPRPASIYSPRDRRDSPAAIRTPSIPVQSSRRESFATQQPVRPGFVDPPPPHMPQAHYFSLPDLGLGFNQKQETGKPAGSNGYCCRLDSLADGGDVASTKKARDALLVGCEGGLEVFRILPNKLEVIGRLEGLSGAVIGAKILPHNDRTDPLQALRPLVAVILHGQIVDPSDEDGLQNQGTASRYFQTVVEVYSLQTQHYIATLYRSAPVALEKPAVGQVSSLPPPVGDLHVDASGRFITISSGISGEIWVFTATPNTGLDVAQYRCIGKFWTVLSTGTTGAKDGSTIDHEATESPHAPIYSLSRRWLAILPPSSSSNISIQGAPLLSEINPSPPGVGSHAAPGQPSVTCDVVDTDIEGTWSRLGRQAAQGLVKYSQRGIEMGLQGWKELTQPSPPNARQLQERANANDEFPPTKAFSDDPSRAAKEPALVSIIDLQSLLQWEALKPKHAPSPMATCALVEGCKFLSLSCTGMRLLTTSRKGETSTVWDLRQAAHGVPRHRSMREDDVSTSPCIRQLQRIVRNTPSTILDCAWSTNDDALALLTAHGTVHLHEVVTVAPLRKRKRTGTVTAPKIEKADATVGLSEGLSPPSSNHGFLGSIKSSWSAVSTQVSSIRGSNPSTGLGIPTTFAGFREATAAAGNAGSRAVARGLSQGYTAAKGGASDYWHADDNKIRHTKALQEPHSARSLAWIKRNNTVSIAIVCGGTVHIHPVQHVVRRKGDDVVSGLKHEKYAHKAFPLPRIHTRAEGRDNASIKPDTCASEGPHGFWSLKHSTSSPPVGTQHTRSAAGPDSDVETNPPYCPFHVDSRVSIFTYDQNRSGSQIGPTTAYEQFKSQGHGSSVETPWTFGGPLPPSIKLNDRQSDDAEYSDFDAPGGDLEDEDEHDVSSQMESKLTIKSARRRSEEVGDIRINTRRRQGKANGGVSHSVGRADGEFEVFEEDARAW